uniref:aralkylamine N-acetyltransferase n=1 Tax=Heliothis virescens TaxID=7102 RepID=A0A2A4J4D3_HELVI
MDVEQSDNDYKTMARFVTITPDMSEAVIQHLRNNFFADEPLNKAVSLCQRGEPHAALERLCAVTIADGLSVAAIEGDTSIEKIQQSSDEKYNKIFTILYSVSQELDLFNTFQVDKILECRIISVDQQARGRGLAKELMARSIDIAKENGFKLFKADATGAYSQRICSSLGMEIIRTVRYADYRDASGTPVFDVPPPHNALAIMVRKIP